eukprot:c3372_g1_i1 orf=39-209(+)
MPKKNHNTHFKSPQKIKLFHIGHCTTGQKGGSDTLSLTMQKKMVQTILSSGGLLQF